MPSIPNIPPSLYLHPSKTLSPIPTPTPRFYLKHWFINLIIVYSADPIAIVRNSHFHSNKYSSDLTIAAAAHKSICKMKILAMCEIIEHIIIFLLHCSKLPAAVVVVHYTFIIYLHILHSHRIRIPIFHSQSEQQQFVCIYNGKDMDPLWRTWSRTTRFKCPCGSDY